MSNRIPMTPEGHSRLSAELKRLKTVERPAVIRAIAAAREHGDLSENAEYKFAKEENRAIEKELQELEAKLKSAVVVSSDHVPEDVVYLGHTVRLLDLSDDSEQLVRLVGEAQPPSADSDVLPVSATSPMGEALMKARVGETIKVKAPRGTLQFKILQIVG